MKICLGDFNGRNMRNKNLMLIASNKISDVKWTIFLIVVYGRLCLLSKPNIWHFICPVLNSINYL